MVIIRVVAIFIAILSNHNLYALSDFYTQHNRGWLYFDEPEVETQKDKKEPVKQIMQRKRGETATMTTQRIEKAYEEAKNLAVIEPTPQNLVYELEFIKAIGDKAEKFANSRQEVLLKNPYLDPSIENPTDHTGLNIKYAEEQKKNIELLAQMKKKIGLYFFFKKSCGYCQSYSSNIDHLRTTLGFETMAISMDGGWLDKYSGPQKNDNGISEKHNIQVVPTVIAVNPRTEKYAVVATGIVAQDTLIKNLLEYGKRLLDENE